uniref:Uncharacterized protein n=1 Tax=Knipowitschia caucasica TaxID=637954 RepID=A0AAV2KXM0_KNICA
MIDSNSEDVCEQDEWKARSPFFVVGSKTLGECELLRAPTDALVLSILLRLLPLLSSSSRRLQAQPSSLCSRRVTSSIHMKKTLEQRRDCGSKRKNTPWRCVPVLQRM